MVCRCLLLYGGGWKELFDSNLLLFHCWSTWSALDISNETRLVRAALARKLAPLYSSNPNEVRLVSHGNWLGRRCFLPGTPFIPRALRPLRASNQVSQQLIWKPLWEYSPSLQCLQRWIIVTPRNFKWPSSEPASRDSLPTSPSPDTPSSTSPSMKEQRSSEK